MPDPANPQSFNRYSYTLNSPLNFVDPTGHVAVQDDGNNCDSSGYCPTWQEIMEQIRWEEENGCVGGTLACADENGNYIQNDYNDEWTEVALNDIKYSAMVAGAWYGGIIAADAALPHLIEAGKTVISWLCLNDGDCGDEIQAASNAGRQSVNWLANQANRINHIINPNAGRHYSPGHDWSQLINYSGNQSQDYQALQPYLDAIVQYGASTTTSTGQTVFVATVNDVPIQVIGNMQSDIFIITDAWIILP